MERRFAVLAGASRNALTASLAIAALLASTTAAAAPKTKNAKAAFSRGVAAYQKGDYPGASKALEESFVLEPDVETLFAWAQAERQQDNCEKAIELYDKLLGFDMPAENKAVIESKREECKAIVAAKTGVLDKPIDPPEEPDPEPRPPRETPTPEGDSPWWKDPIADTLLGAGVIGLGVGGYFLLSASNAEQESFERHARFEELQDKAESHGRIGVIVTAAGGVLLVGGIIRAATRSSSSERTQVSGWLSPDGGGVTAFGRF